MRRSTHFRIKGKKTMYKLSILIPTLSSRSKKLKKLTDALNYQIQTKPVQWLSLGDNKSMTVGEKRNLLIDMAKGDFVAFVDDDDNISPDYIDTLLKAIDDNPNKTVICFHGQQTTDGKKDLPFRYNINFGRNHKKMIDGQRWKVMLPDHLCCWNKSKITVKFPHKNLGEDHSWAREMAFTYTEEDQVLLTDNLYHYNYDKNVTECRR
jgi:glycosyltransferase involved in cell wall biosynthesis